MNWLKRKNREFNGKKWEGRGWESKKLFFWCALGSNIQCSTNTEKEQVIIKKTCNNEQI
jgi:hypothetical protein